MIEFKSGIGCTTEIGFTNNNDQICCGTLGVPGTDHNQVAYKMNCKHCGFVYGANGSDIAGRNCPNCLGGADGIPFWLSNV